MGPNPKLARGYLLSNIRQHGFVFELIDPEWSEFGMLLKAENQCWD